jgi:hypothetical protein
MYHYQHKSPVHYPVLEKPIAREACIQIGGDHGLKSAAQNHKINYLKTTVAGVPE